MLINLGHSLILAYSKADSGLETREFPGKLAKKQILKFQPLRFCCFRTERALEYVFLLK